MAPQAPHPTIKQQILQLREELDKSFSNFSSVKRTNNLNWLRRQIAYEEPQTLCPVPKKYFDYTSMSNIAIAYDYIMNNLDQEISVSNIRYLHHILCQDTNIDGLNFRTANCKLQMTVNGQQYNAPDSRFIEYELAQIAYQINHSKHDTFTRAYDAHYDIIMLQPFDDFNKRTARLIMNWILLKDGFRPITFNTRSDKQAYIQAISDRANGNKRAYTEYMSKCQLRTQRAILKHLRDSRVL